MIDKKYTVLMTGPVESNSGGMAAVIKNLSQVDFCKLNVLDTGKNTSENRSFLAAYISQFRILYKLINIYFLAKSQNTTYPYLQWFHVLARLFTLTGREMYTDKNSFHYIFKADSRVKQFQVVQDRFDRVEIRLVTDNKIRLDNEGMVEKRICQEFEEVIELVFNFVDTIEPEKSGKYRRLVCRVAT
ncbi:hypothetical protein [Geoalkalibacter subterraneus]|uniref:hypothetical protein n=1 Tax=Geoalkalibacter subterraneus TaxID=483547 RepID=UPI001185E123|nr:hypothetical protein [Geoalkalibacter subterraneus]